jgi:hypothetical protein
MAPGVIRKSFDDPDQAFDYLHGSTAGVQAGDSVVWRSTLNPGWSWDTDVKPFTEGLTSCPMDHRELIVSGRIKYVMLDGTTVIGQPGDHLRVYPGHRAWVEGEEPCVCIDW